MENEVPSSYKKSKEQKPSSEKEHSSLKTKPETHLLHNIKLNIGEKRKRFFVFFYSDTLECETLIPKEMFLNFYTMMKNAGIHESLAWRK